MVAADSIMDLDRLTKKMLAGYIYGGIYASQAQTSGDADRLTSASASLFPVYLSPAPSKCAAFASAATKD